MSNANLIATEAADAAQIRLEERFSLKNINCSVEDEIQNNPDNKSKIAAGVILLKAWISQSYYPSKDARLRQLDPLSFEQLVNEVFTTVAYCQKPVPFVSVAGYLAMRIGFDNHVDSIKTVAEVIAVLCSTDAFDINKPDKKESLEVISKLQLSDGLIKRLEECHFITPMVSPPEIVTNNFQSAYLTYNESLILGSNNNHVGDICLDVINRQNSVQLTLNEAFLTTVPEIPRHEIDTAKKLSEWNQFLTESRDVYALMLAAGNKFYLTNNVDKRGRLYARGYHISTQGTPYKKAMLELAHQELITGVPV